jgi:hypothetical protein
MGPFSVISVFSVVHANDADIEMPQVFGSYLLPPQNFHQRGGGSRPSSSQMSCFWRPTPMLKRLPSGCAGLGDHSHPAFAELLQDLVLQDSPADHGPPKTLARG